MPKLYHSDSNTPISKTRILPRAARDRIRDCAKEVPGPINQQSLGMRLEHVLLQNGESRVVASQTGTAWGIARENSNLGVCGQLFVYFPDGRVKIRIYR